MDTRFRIDKQVERSVSPSSIIISNGSNEGIWFAPSTGADRIFFYDNSANSVAWLDVSTGLTISGTTLTANVHSVNGQTGAVNLTTTNISEGTNLYFTDERVDDRVATLLQAGTNITLNYNDAANTLTISATAGAGGYTTVQEEGSNLTARSTINFIGEGITATDNAGNSRTDVTLDATLNALAAYNTNGLLTQTAADTFTGRSLTAPAAGITITNNNGVAGNPTFALANDLAAVEGLSTTGVVRRTGTDTWTAGGVLTVAEGGTGLTSVFDQGIVIGSGTSALTQVVFPGTTSYLRYNSSTFLLEWDVLSSADLSNDANLAKLDGNQTFTGNNTFNNVIVNNVTPTLGTHLVNKSYVDNLLTGLDWKNSVRAASTANVTVTYNSTGGTSARGQITAAPNTLDGVSLAANNRILLKDQTTGAQNGIWVVTTVGSGSNGVWDRATDFDQDAEVTSGAAIFVTEGTTNGDKAFVLTTNDPITIGGASGTALTFVQFSGGTTVVDGAGLLFSGNILNVQTASSARIVVNADNIDLATTAVTPDSYGSATQVGTFTVDAYGRLTAASNVSIAITSAAITDFNEAAQDAVGNILTDSAQIDFTYNDAGNTITATVIDDSITFAKVQNIATNKLLGRSTAGTGDIEQLNVIGTISGGTYNPAISFNFTQSDAGFTWATTEDTVQSSFIEFVKGAGVTLEHDVANAAVKISHSDTSSVTNLDTSAAQVIDLLTFDTYGHVQSVTTRNLTPADIGASSTSHTHTLDDLSDVVITAPSNGQVLKYNGTNWANSTDDAGVTVVWGYIENSTATTIDLDANTGVVKDRNGNDIAFTLPSNIDNFEVYRNGQLLARTGSLTTRDYQVNVGTNEITLAYALTVNEILLVKKYT